MKIRDMAVGAVLMIGTTTIAQPNCPPIDAIACCNQESEEPYIGCLDEHWNCLFGTGSGEEQPPSLELCLMKLESLRNYFLELDWCCAAKETPEEREACEEAKCNHYMSLLNAALENPHFCDLDPDDVNDRLLMCLLRNDFGCREPQRCDRPPPFPAPPVPMPMPVPGSAGVDPDDGELDDLPPGDPFGRIPRLDGIDLSTGEFSTNEVDLNLPSPGFNWPVAREYRGLNVLPGSAVAGAVQTIQGANWRHRSFARAYFDSQQYAGRRLMRIDYGYEGVLTFFEAAAPDGTDYDSTPAVFRSLDERQSGAVIGKTIGAPVWEFTSANGTRTYFFANGPRIGRLWKIEDASGNTAWIGHGFDAQLAASSQTAWTSDGEVQEIFDPAGRKYVYTYSANPIPTDGGIKRLIGVEVFMGSNAIARVSYDYYTQEDDHGTPGDLRTAKTEMALSGTGDWSTKTRYYRYYKANGTSIPRSHLLKMVVGAEGCRQYDLVHDPATPNSFFQASDEALKPYAERFMTYNHGSTALAQVATYFTDGQCGCGGSAAGTWELSYDTNGAYTNGPLIYDEAWKQRTVVKRPDGSYETTYTDEVGLMTAKVVSDGNPAVGSAQHWVTQIVRNQEGRTEELRTPEAIQTYNHTTGTITPYPNQGLVQTFEYYRVKPYDGILKSVRWKIGTNATAPQYYVSSDTFIDRTVVVHTIAADFDVTVSRMLPSESWEYTLEGTVRSTLTSPQTGSHVRTSTYAFHAAPASPFEPKMLAIKSRTTTYPAVSTANNGSGQSAVETAYLLPDGRTLFLESRASSTGAPIIDYSGYDPVTGQLNEFVLDVDVDTVRATLPSWVPQGYTSSGSPLHQSTKFEFDALGRATATILHAHSTSKQRKAGVVYTRLADGRDVIIKYPRFNPAVPEYFGPASFTVRDHFGNTVAQGTLEIPAGGTTTAPFLWVDRSQSDPLLAMQHPVTGYRTQLPSESGARLNASRVYFNLESTPPSFEETTYTYDVMGRRITTRIPSGTINETLFDAIGRVSSIRIGTNNAPSGGNMVTTELFEYDNNAIGNGNRTKVTKRVGATASSSDREFKTIFDARGRAVVAESPLSPHSVMQYDNLGRVVRAATYNSATGLSLSTNPAAVAASRLSYSETRYDERGRVFEFRSYKVEQPGGPTNDAEPSGGRPYVARQTWYDHEGRTVKSVGEIIEKSAYDRIGRLSTAYTIAQVNDAVYADALTVDGDHVLEQTSSVYDTETDNLLMSVSVRRFHDDLAGGSGTTGSLDTNADGSSTTVTASNLKGRASIAAWYYDALDREIEAIDFGNHGGADFSYPSVAPARSDTVLRTSTSYAIDGRVDTVEGPDGVKSRSLYDDAGRAVAAIANFVSGQPASSTTNVHTRTDYLNGLMTRLWVDVDADGSVDTDDQQTLYTYGVSPNDTDGPSVVSASHVLRRVQYPDSTGTTDSVTYSYNAQLERVRVKDQAGNVIEHDMDALGRLTHRRATTIVGGFDDSVKRISIAYDDRGLPSAVTQHNDATVGSGVVIDQVTNAFDAWGNLARFRQDWNSAVAGSGGDDADIAFAYEERSLGSSGPALRSVRRNQIQYAARTIALNYDSAGNSLDDAAGRVSSFTYGGIVRSTYQYLGVADVVGVSLPEPRLHYRRYDPSAPRAYARLDRFDRVRRDIWDRTVAEDAYDVDVYHVEHTLDRNGNVTLSDDKVYPAIDYSYTMDARQRLTDASYGEAANGTIATPTSLFTWNLSLVGNWDVRTYDADGDGLFTSPADINQTATFNLANEMATRVLNGVQTTPTYDAVGNMTSDGKAYTYHYDVWGRLREVRTPAPNVALVAEYRYNGLGYRTGWHYDVDAAGGVTDADPWYHFVYDESWRAVATYRAAMVNSVWTRDQHPKEVFVHHLAGVGGVGGDGGGLPMDFVAFRDREQPNPNPPTDNWPAAAGATLDERTYLCQNWRGDVVAVFSHEGILVNQVRYDPYGMPFAIPSIDFNGDGLHDLIDFFIWFEAYDLESTDPTVPRRRWADVNFDDEVDLVDFFAFQGEVDTAVELGRGKLGYPSGRSHGNVRRGYAGAELAAELVTGAPGTYHMRHRVYQADEGRWTRRDPIGYHDGMNLYEYVGGGPVGRIDPSGLMYLPCSSGACGGGGEPPPIEPTLIGGDTPKSGRADGWVSPPGELRCLPIKGVPGSHCYWLFPDGTSCGGHDPDAPNFWNNTPIITECKPFDRSLDKDYSRTRDRTPEQDPATKIKCPPGSEIGDFQSCLQRALKRIADCKIRYRWHGPNSNSTIRTAIEACLPKGCKLETDDGEPRVFGDHPAIGWGQGFNPVRKCLRRIGGDWEPGPWRSLPHVRPPNSESGAPGQKIKGPKGPSRDFGES